MRASGELTRGMGVARQLTGMDMYLRGFSEMTEDVDME